MSSGPSIWGAVRSGESGGNNIGAFVAKCPGAMEEQRDDNAKEGTVAGRGGGGTDDDG